MEQEIEFRVVSDICLSDIELRYVYWRVKPKNWLGKIFIPWRQLKRAYRCIDGYTDFFKPQDFKELKCAVKTKSDLEKWINTEELIANRHKNMFQNEWDEVLKQKD